VLMMSLGHDMCRSFSKEIECALNAHILIRGDYGQFFLSVAYHYNNTAVIFRLGRST
jgi:hypothetical protein